MFDHMTEKDRVERSIGKRIRLICGYDQIWPSLVVLPNINVQPPVGIVSSTADIEQLQVAFPTLKQAH
jgi:hypothetical protein